MLKEAFEYLVGLKAPTVVQVDGTPYVTKDVVRVGEVQPETLHVHDLQGLVDFVGLLSPLPMIAALVVVSPFKVRAVTSLIGRDLKRGVLAEAEAEAVEHPFGRFMDQEHFTIWGLTGFVRDDAWAAVVDVSSALTAQSTVSHTDDGISQTVSILDGVQRQKSTTIPSPLMLRPYRTFAEVEQPESPFIFRVKKDDEAAIPLMGLFPAFDVSWKSRAVASIAAFLRAKVSIPVLS